MEFDEWTDKAGKTHIFYLHETVGQSYARDAGTFTLILALWSIGHFAQSGALEWIGVLLALLVICGRLVAILKKSAKQRMTPAEARKWLDENFPEATQ